MSITITEETMQELYKRINGLTEFCLENSIPPAILMSVMNNINIEMVFDQLIIQRSKERAASKGLVIT